MLKSVTQDIIQDESFHLPVEPAATVLRDAKELVLKHKEYPAEFELMERNATKELASCLSSSTKETSFKNKHSYMCRSYHALRCSSNFKLMWVQFFTSIGIANPKPYLYQEITDRIFDRLIKDTFPVLESNPATSSQSNTVTYGDANVIRFAAGYVCKHLKEKVESSQQNSHLLRCIINLIDNSTQHEGSLTADWITLIDRGGLCHVKEATFLLFNAIEEETREHFKPSQITNITNSKETIDKAIIENEEVQFHWSILASDFNKTDADHVLAMIVELWVRIRGNSFTNGWVELYKQSKKKTVQRSKALRKGLT